VDVRRVVTGHNVDGKAVFVSDEKVAPLQPRLLPGSEFHRLWGGDDAPHYPDGGAPPAQKMYFPPVGGFRFGFFTIPPQGGGGEVPADLDIQQALGELDELMPGLAQHMEPDAPGMHTTATVDFEVVLSGQPTLELDDGAIAYLSPGDTVVQNGTRHRWSNSGTVPAVLAVFIVGAHHDGVTAGEP
jgi:mannose-6-phosphate isomerase-like protein (cupin superfamily)